MAKKKVDVAECEKEPTPMTYGKTALMQSKRYAGVRDAINTLVGDDEHLTLSEMDARLNKKMKGKVK